MAPQALQVNARQPQPDIIERAAAALRDGHLVVFPTDTVYGVGCNSSKPEAVDRLYAAKGRPRDLPLILLLADPDRAPAYASAWPPAAQRAAARFWPGGITLVVPKARDVPKSITAGRDTIGLRVPDHAAARALIRAAGFAPATTSANRSGQPNPVSADEVMRTLGPHLAVVLDAGPSPLGMASTVLDVTGLVPAVLRQGAVSIEDLRRELGEVAAPGEPRP